MADTKTTQLEREYTIPLRRFWMNVPQYERTGKAIKTIRKFIAKHMKIPQRDESRVKLDVYFNNELWFRGRANPPAKIKVIASKDGDNVKVNLAEIPAHITFLKAKHAKIHTKTNAKPSEEKHDHAGHNHSEHEHKETPEEKKVEQEKEKSVAEFKMKDAEASAKAQKHATKVEKAAHPHRMALKK